MKKQTQHRAHSRAPQKERSVWFQQNASFPMRDTSPVELEKFWASQVQADVDPAHRWDCLGPANIAGRVTSLTIHPHNAKQWFAGSATGGVWVSNDEGKSWQPTWSRFANQNIGALGWLENRRMVGGLFLMAATGEANMSSDSYPGSGVYMSTDAGLTWQPLFGQPAGVADDLYRDVRTFPRRIGSMAYRGNRMVFGSIFLDNSLPAGLYLFDGNFQACEYWGKRSYNCHSVLMHPHDEKLLYASIEPDGAHNGIWRSRDFGKRWVHLTRGLPPPDQFRRTSLAFAPSDPDVIYALAADKRDNVLGIFRSSNGGDSWREILNGRYPHERQMSYNNTIAVHPHKPDHIVWGGMHLYRTDDAGRHWRRITSTIPGKSDYVHGDHHALLWPEPDLLISGNDGGVAVSRDGGRTWASRSSGMKTTMFYSVEVAPSNGNVVAGGTQDNGILVGGVARKSTPIDWSWTPAISGDGSWIAFDPSNAQNVFACVSGFRVYHHRPGKPWDASGWNNVQPSEITPEEANARAFTVMAMEPSTRSTSRTLWAGTVRLWRADSNGRNWRPASGSFDNSPISAIAISQRRPKLMFVGTTSGGIHRSDDGGQTWTQSLSSIDIPARAITDIQFHPARPATIVVTVASSGIKSSGVELSSGKDLPYRHVFQSDDLGNSWTDVDQGGLPNVVYYAACFATTPPYRLFVAGDLGVWVRMKPGWLDISGNLPSVVVSDLVYHAKDHTLTAATYGRGVWRMKPGKLVWRARSKHSRLEQIDQAAGLRVDRSVRHPVQLTPPAMTTVKDPKRRTVVTVRPVPGAMGYQVQLFSRGNSVTFSSRDPEIKFSAPGVGSWEWRVWAIFADGLRSPASPWRPIIYAH